MAGPLPLELRERVVSAYQRGEGSFTELGKRFAVGRATVERWVNRHREKNTLAPKPMGGSRRKPKVDAEGQKFIRETFEALPDSTLPELSEAYQEVFEVEVSPQTLSDTVRRMGYTKKEGVFRAQAAYRPDVVAARDAYQELQPKMKSQRMIFFDESGFNLAMKRARGWAMRGVTPVIEAPAKGTAVTMLGAIGLDGPRAMRIHKGSVNGEVLLNYLRLDLGPTLKPGDIVLMDGPRLHRIAGVAEVLAEFGAKVFYLPAYSPELNPIEMTWSWLKDKIRAIAPRHLALLKDKLSQKWQAIKSDQCAGWLKHSGYPVALST